MVKINKIKWLLLTNVSLILCVLTGVSSLFSDKILFFELVRKGYAGVLRELLQGLMLQNFWRVLQIWGFYFGGCLRLPGFFKVDGDA